MKRTRLIPALLLLLAALTLSGCHTPSPDNADTTTPAETTPALTTPSESDIRTAEYDFELWGYGPVIKIDDAGERYVQLDLLVSCVSGRDYYISSHSFSPARAWLLLPDIAAIIPSAPQDVTVTPTQIDVNAGDSFNVSLRFYDLPQDFDVGSHDFLVSEYDDATGDGDHDKRLLEDVEVGIYTAKYDFELQGDVVLGLGYRGNYLSARISCTTTCISGRGIYWDGGNFAPVGKAELIAPDGTIYTFSPLRTTAVTQVNVKQGDVFEDKIVFEHLPLDLAPGKYDIKVYLSGSVELFEDVTVGFEQADPSTLPPFSQGLPSADNVQGIGIKMGDTIAEAKSFAATAYKCTGVDEAAEDNFYYSDLTKFNIEDSYDTQKLLAEGCPVLKYESAYDLINNIKQNKVTDVSLSRILDARMQHMESGMPPVPGFYWMVFTVSYDHPQANKEITPTIGEWYTVEEQYCIGVIVE